MKLRFECVDSQKEKHIYCLEGDGKSLTLLKFRGISTAEKSLGAEKWDTLGYFGSITSAIERLINHGVLSFPGTLVELVQTIEDLSENIRTVLRPFEFKKETVTKAVASAMNVDPVLIAETDKDTPVAVDPTDFGDLS